VAAMSESRVEASVVSNRGRLWVSGGHDAEMNILTSIEVYNPNTNVWSKVDSTLISECLEVKLCVLPTKQSTF